MEFLFLLLPIGLLALAFGGGGGDDDSEPGGGEETGGRNGTEGDDVIQSGPEDDTVSGGSGNDLIFGNRGDDFLSGNAGQDVLQGGLGDDTLAGNGGNDLLIGDDGDDSASGGEGDDLLLGSAGDDRLFGDDGDDVLVGGSGANALYGGAGDDVLSSLDPRGGLLPRDLSELDTDALRVGLANRYGDALTEAAANRVVNGVLSSDAATGPDLLDGGDGEDFLLGDNGDTLIGGLGEDRFAVDFTPGDAAVVFRDLDTLAGEEIQIDTVVAPTAGTPFLLRATADGSGSELVLGTDVVAIFEGLAPGEISLGTITLVTNGSTGAVVNPTR